MKKRAKEKIEESAGGNRGGGARVMCEVPTH